MNKQRDNPVHWWKYLLSCFGAICLFVTAVVIYYIPKTTTPINPIPTGSFPKEPVWIIKADENISATPVVYDSFIFFRTAHKLYKAKSEDGSIIWHTDISPTLTLSWTPIITDGLIIVPEEKSTIAAYSTETGNFTWRTNPIYDFMGYESGRIGSYQIWENILFVGHVNSGLYAYDIKNGQQIWKTDVPNRSSLFLSVDDKAVYLGVEQSVLAYDRKTGNLLWEKDFSNLVGPILAKNNLLYISLLFSDDCLFAINLDTSTTLWKLSSSEIKSNEIRYLSIEGEVLYIAADHLSAISIKDGKIYWISEYTGRLENPIIYVGNIYIRNISKSLYVIDKLTGKTEGQLLVRLNTPMNRDPTRSPVIVNILLIVPFGDNRLLAYPLKGI